jgi:hypothetical protein
MSLLTPALRYGKRVLNILPEFVVGTGAEVVGAGMRNTKGSIWAKVKGGATALEKDIAKKSVKNGGFFKRTYKELVSTPKAIVKEAKIGVRAARIAGKSAAKGVVKGGLKAISKRLPCIGALITVLMEAPNIYTAFKEGGFAAGMKEIGGAGIELGGMAAGAAIGSAICPGIGTIIGSFVGDMVGSFIRGKTYSDKQEEAQEAAEPVQYSDEEISNLQKIGYSEEEIVQLQQNGWTYDEIIEELKKESDQDSSATESKLVSQVESDSTSTNGYTDEYQKLQTENEKVKKELEDDQQWKPLIYQEMTYNPYLNNNYSMGAYTNSYMTGIYGGQFGNYSNGFMFSPWGNYSFSNPFASLSQNQYFKYYTA